MKFFLVVLIACVVFSEAMMIKPSPSFPPTVIASSGAPLIRSDKDTCLAKRNRVVLPVKKRQCKQRRAMNSTVVLIIYVIYVPIIFAFYLVQVVVVIVNKHKPEFRSSYFSLFVVESLVCLSTTVLSTVIHKLIIFPEVNSFYTNFPSNGFTTALYFAGFYFTACLEYTNIFIALNRLSALVMYTKYERVWRRLFWLCLPVIFGFPFISYYHLLDVSVFLITPNNGADWVFIYDESKRPWMFKRSNRVITFYLYLACSTVTLTLNFTSVVILKCKKFENVASIEIKLFLLGYSSFACGLPMIAQQSMYTIESTLPLIIYAIYVPIVFVIYLAQVIIVIKNKRKAQFRSSYFTLFIIEAFTGLSTCMVTTITHKLILFPEVNEFYANFPSNAITTGLYFTSYYFPACEEYTNIFIALNRLSALALYEKYERVWNWLGWFCLPIIFGFPFISYYHLLDTKTAFFTLNNGTTWYIDYDHSVRPWRSNRVSSFYLYLVCSITTLTLNLATLVVLRCMSMEKVSSIEIRLFVLGFSSFACGVPMTIQQCIYMYTKSDEAISAMGYRLPWLYDLKALTPGILSLIFSTAIRNQLKRGLRMRTSTTVSGLNQQDVLPELSVESCGRLSRNSNMMTTPHRHMNYTVVLCNLETLFNMFTVESTLPLIVYFVYVPILFVIYLAQVFIVAVNKKKPQFSSSYYTLFLIQALTGLTTIIVTTVTFRLVLFPEVNSFYAYFPDNWIATGFLAYYLPACEEYTKICIALNRLSAIALYSRYERVWSRVVWLCLIFIIGMPFVSYYHLMDTHTAF
ncbi:hypothetical protein PRIPAC_83604 [Pristionchus pacificus]|uniref:Serpentine receptor class gamma n=1 Tax=Pristionchus pacificus TaxID=54126 RepID=A0A2A6BUV2_PRIPA|nr:hypothetical protein PRIPAC_83604 [Pristionchus pacificus]|eukprot:PDM69583.1 G protein-coupled receptor [Pristionchus pacificus]